MSEHVLKINKNFQAYIVQLKYWTDIILKEAKRTEYYYS